MHRGMIKSHTTSVSKPKAKKKLSGGLGVDGNVTN